MQHSGKHAAVPTVFKSGAGINFKMGLSFPQRNKAIDMFFLFIFN